MIKFNKLQYIKLNHIDDNYFLVADVFYSDKKYTINILLDKNTAFGFKSIFKCRPFKDKYEGEYKYFYSGLSVDKTNNIFYHLVKISLNKKRHKQKEFCSKRFCQNLKWLLELNNIDELSEIIIKKNIV